ncbi:transposase [Leucobacter exalbidus]|uniref:Transposase n=1 Tax=Leucobacter exalbidus TaxID=662960 RepID=A0A940PJI3_9MICO|nr:IS21 family transposase [Leucobacter exalbidus]MBP1325042.1 transposase [Leucobacter exalbidus]
MTNYRQIMLLLLQDQSYRQIASIAACSQTTISKARRVLHTEQLTTSTQINALTAEDLDRLFNDGRKSVPGEFVPVDIEKIIAARLGRKKPPLKVLWAKYLKHDPMPGARFYGYERFCQIVAEHVRTNDLTSPIVHVPGHTMQVDWAGTPMFITDPITRTTTKVSVFVATLPYSGLVFAYGCLDEKQPAWLDAHRRAFEYFGGVTLVVVPDNASTASNQISRAERARDVNPAYAEFLEYHQTAAVPTRSYRPRDKGHVEAGVKIITNWVIHYLADQVFASLDDLNAAVAERVESINQRTPFRGEHRSRVEWFNESERDELISLPERRWEPVTWRNAKVHRDWHIQIDTIKYSVPYEFAGRQVSARIIGDTIDVLSDGEIIATHHRGQRKNGYVTVPDHAPAYMEETAGLWTRAYFLRQAAKVGPGTVAALERLLDGKKIEAQGFRSCMNILELGKRSNRSLLEHACRQLTDEDPHRQISYTAVKHRLTAIRAEHHARPQTESTGRPGVPSSAGAGSPGVRDTSRAYLAGAAAFSLDALTGRHQEGRDDV